MSKTNHKSKEFVGATIGRPHFGGITKKENGITLIALIITIIVMLILTGVTLSITLGDNGLVNKAQEASEEMQVAMDRELLLSAAIGAMGNDGKVNLSAMVLPEGFTGSNGTYTSKNGNTFTVSEMGDIVYTGGSDSDEGTAALDLSGKYYLDVSITNEYMEIINNSVIRTVYYDESNNDTEIYNEWEISSINEENNTYEIIDEYYDYEEPIITVYSFPYMIIKENGKIINKVIVFDGTFGFQNMNGISFPLDGEYISQDGDKKIEIEGNRYLKIYIDQDDYDGHGYCRINDIYYLDDGSVIEVSDNQNSITIDGVTYIKQ